MANKVPRKKNALTLQTQITFAFKFTTGDREYNFTRVAASEAEAKAFLKEDMEVFITELNHV